MVSYLALGCSLVGLAFIILCIGLRHVHIAAPLFFGLIVRLFAMMANHSILLLAESGSDDVAFELHAWSLGQSGFSAAWASYEGPNSYFISWVISIFYSIFGRNELLAQSLSLWFGMGICILGAALTSLLWGLNTRHV